MDENVIIWLALAVGAYLLYHDSQSATSTANPTSTPIPTYTPQQQAFLNALAAQGVTLSTAQIAQMISGASLNAVMTPSQLAQLQAHGLDQPAPSPNPTPAIYASSVGTVANAGLSGYPWERF